MGHQLRFQSTVTLRVSRFTHGGELRKRRSGRRMRILSSRSAVHLVFKIDKRKIRSGLRTPKVYQICQNTIKKYAKRFAVKIEQLAICDDHIHALIRITRRSFGLHFFRVVAGQVAQELKNNDLWVRGAKSIWKHRPFTRVVFGVIGFQIAKNYVRLNEKEARGEIPYRKTRLRGLLPEEWRILWV